ncbi:uncharacterized protein (DUF697 family) [Isoptericola sp. CG 20/1183]|uniref:Uncharacterized protein (DUF697 family) n=1 Tax=Isoptericola halotolerans TaxID=300560 RepID=A0ABX5EIQ4_9MICO|nr:MULTISPECIES: DUF697 domain-containing protein [Isoptericola]PRZ08598.1 uncharacterized protein (DUF697 family) [Isoptericola halotolerans]PRZ10955.1 uncharacterized protein (DUF697 family) [Isoptericola sp. CG 20/1183]
MSRTDQGRRRQGGTPGQPGSEGEDRGFDPTPIIDAEREQRAKIGRFNLAVVGGTGVGKSSLINAIFGKDSAPTGVGMPVTKGIDYHLNPDGSLGIWDFEGFEAGSVKTPEQHVSDGLSKIAAGPREQQIAVVWYCILASSGRLTENDVRLIRTFAAQGLHVILVLTKVQRAKDRIAGPWVPSGQAVEMLEFLQDPRDENGDPIDLPVAGAVMTAAVDQGKFGGPRHGLEDLLALTLATAPEENQDALRVVQELSLPLRRELALRYINAAAASAMGIAATPIPFADAVALAPIQLTMMGKVAAAYRIDFKVMLSAQALSQLGIQYAGRATARSLVKLVPGIGSLINAAVAGAITYVTGQSWMRLCEAVHTKKVNLDDVEKAWKEYGPTAQQVLRYYVKFARPSRAA